MKIKGIAIVAVIIIGAAIYFSTYIVSETQQVVVTQFGRIVGEPIAIPG